MGRLLRGSLVLSASVAVFAPIFHLPNGEFLHTGLGDWMDPHFINYLLEHWYQALRTWSNPASPPMYYPQRGTLGYSIGLVLWTPFYIPARLFVGPLPAYTLTLFLVVETGTLALYAIFRMFLRLTFLESLLLTGFVALSPNLVNGYSGIWAQTLSAFQIPPILLITLWSGRFHDQRLRAGAAALAGLLTALLFVQDFYTGWLGLLLVALITVGIAIINWTGLWASLVDAWRTDRPRLLGWLAGAAAGSAIFIAIYLPPYLMFKKFEGEQLMNALKWVDPDGWRDPLQWVRDMVAFESAAPFLLAGAMGILAWLPWSRLDRRSRWLAVWFVIVAGILFTSAVKFERYSVWKRLFQHLPGAPAIRDPKRLIFDYQFMVALVAGLFLARLPKRSVVRFMTAGIILLLVIRGRPGALPFKRPTATFQHWIERPIAIEPGCRSFFIKGASYEYFLRWENPWALYGLDAMFIALKVGLPTLNGYSAWQPPDWRPLMNPQGPLYAQGVADWIALHDLRGVCELDIEKRTMVPYRRRPTHP